MSNLKINIITNYIGQGYLIFAGIICTPLYLSYLGAESYGLVGFFILLQNWLNLLDMGLSTTLGRQVAVARTSRDHRFTKFSNLLRSFEIIFFILALLIFISIYLNADWISQKWIKPNQLNSKNIALCINIMALIIGLKFFATIYRSGINGFEDQIWLNKITIVTASFKYLFSLIILAYISSEVVFFFVYQFIISILEVLLLRHRFYSNLPSDILIPKFFRVNWRYFTEVVPFALGITYTTAIVAALTQLDKLLLSGSLSLMEFGYYSLLTLLSGGIINLSVPVFLAYQPKLTMLASKNNIAEMIALYRGMTQLITWITFTAASLIILYSQQIIYILTSDNNIYTWGSDVLFWYTLGSACYVIGTFQYYLQNAFGTLKLYVYGSTVALLIQVPVIYFVTMQYGAIGAGKLWFCFSVVWFLIFTSTVHSKLIPNFHMNWLIKDMIPLLVWIIILTYFMKNYIHIEIYQSKIIIFMELILIGFSFLVATSVCSSLIRDKVFSFFKA